MPAVTTLPGGAADKLGNRYEHLWLVLRITEMLEGHVSQIRLEPPGVSGTGIEFTVEVNGATWGEQTKDEARNWTINRLIKEGVVHAARIQIDQGRHYRFVASSSASELDTLADRARNTETFTEYTENLGGGRRTALTNVARACEVSEEDAWIMLQKIEVEHQPLDALKRIVSTTLKRLYTDDSDLVAGELRNFCDTHLHQTFTATQVLAHLKSKGLSQRLIVGDSNIINGLKKTGERHRRRIDRATPKIGLVPRGDVDSVVEMLRDSDGKQIVVVDGQAGSGKSTVVSAVAAALERDGWFVAVARMDTDDTTLTSINLGQAIGLTDSPSVILAGVSNGLPALLVIDQLDAVSTYSGRMPDNFEAVDEVLDEVARAPNVKVLLVARTVDLNDDPRLRSLLQSEDRVGRYSVGDLDIDAVKAQIVDYGMQVPASDSTIELLRRPLHLSIFSRLSDGARALEYTTLQGLYEAYTRDLLSRVRGRIGNLHWVQITNAMVGYMSEHEVLAAPAIVLDGASHLEVEALASESVIVRDGAYVAFFHESYFDFLFARSFIADNGDLRSFLLDSGQHLFRRAQTRQVLEHLAATDPARFIAVSVDLFECDEIRLHLKTVVIRVLRQFQPRYEDWEALESLAWHDSPIGLRITALLNLPGWFDATDLLGRWQGWLNDPDRAEQACYQLTLVAQQRPLRVSELVRPHIAESESWKQCLSFMISRALNSELVDLAVELVQLGQLDDMPDQISEYGDFWLILHSLAREDPARAARLIGAFLQRGLVRARQVGSDDPFESGHLSSDSQSATVISDVADKAPVEFVEHVLPFVIDVATANLQQRDEFLPAGHRWAHRWSSRRYEVGDILFNAVDAALRKLADEDPAKCATELAGLRHVESEELRFLACRTLTLTHDPDDAIGWIISDRRNLCLGWTGSPCSASRELIEQCSSDCSPDLFEELESAILEFWPNWESRPKGYRQYGLLSALDTNRMSAKGKRRLQEMTRRFQEPPPQAPESPVAHWVAPPISDEASMCMSDDNWIRALKTHNSDLTNWAGTVPVGGARQLADVLGRRSAEDPERFARLALRFTDEIPADAMNEIIRNVESSADIDVLTDLCEHARDVYGTAVGRAVCSAIARSRGANSRLVALLSAYANDPDPDSETAQTASGSGGVFFGGDLYLAGLNSTRGQAALAAASVIFAEPDHIDTLLPVVDILAQDDILAVRVCAAEAVLALFRDAPENALDLAETLFEAQVEVLDTNATERLLDHTLFQSSERFAHVLAKGLAGTAEVATRAGRIWSLARLRDRLPSDVERDFRLLPPAARIGAATVLCLNVSDCLDVLPLVFDDDDRDVRAESWRAMQSLDEVTQTDQVALIDAFISSTAFEEQTRSLIHALEQLTSTLPSNSITVCERAVGITGPDLGDIRTSSAAMSRDLITVVLRLYRQGDAHTRSRCLNVVDKLTEFNAYDLDQALNDIR